MHTHIDLIEDEIRIKKIDFSHLVNHLKFEDDEKLPEKSVEVNYK